MLCLVVPKSCPVGSMTTLLIWRWVGFQEAETATLWENCWSFTSLCRNKIILCSLVLREEARPQEFSAFPPQVEILLLSGSGHLAIGAITMSFSRGKQWPLAAACCLSSVTRWVKSRAHLILLQELTAWLGWNRDYQATRVCFKLVCGSCFEEKGNSCLNLFFQFWFDY